MILEEDGAAIFDPVEFDPALRRIDTAADLAFLVMELIEAGRDDLAAALVSEYREAGGDDGGDELLAFYAAYRSWVRAKVSCLRAAELPAGERRRRELEHARATGGARRAPVLARAQAARAGRLRRGRRRARPFWRRRSPQPPGSSS